MLRYLIGEDYAIPINRLWLTILLLDYVVVYKVKSGRELWVNRD